MTLGDLWLWIQTNSIVVAVLVLAFPVVVLTLAGALRVIGRLEASQQVANGGIAVGLAAVLVELMGLAYAVREWGAESLADLTIGSLLGPVWLLVAGIVVEHFVHPGKQENVRSRVRGLLLVVVVVGVLAAVFSVLRIHMLIFSGMLGFLLFLAAIVAVFWGMLRYLI